MFAVAQLSPFQVSVVNLSTGFNLNYLWDFGDGGTDSQAFPSHYYTSTGKYNLCLTVSNSNGCGSTYCDSIEVDSLGYVFRGLSGFSLNVVSPSQITGFKEIDPERSFNIFPNPVNTHLTITSKYELSTYRLISILGKELLSGKISGLENMINIGKIKKGIYLLEVTFVDGSKSFKSIVKE
jgi:PKD repeat protein